MGRFRSWVGMLARVGSQESHNFGACKESVEHVLFVCASYDFQGPIFGTV